MTKYAVQMVSKRGLTGSAGTQGIQGIKGDVGATGAVGDAGSQGIQGETGLSDEQLTLVKKMGIWANATGVFEKPQGEFFAKTESVQAGVQFNLPFDWSTLKHFNLSTDLWVLDIGDGSPTLIGSSPILYTAAGTYILTLTLTNAFGSHVTSTVQEVTAIPVDSVITSLSTAI